MSKLVCQTDKLFFEHKTTVTKIKVKTVISMIVSPRPIQLQYNDTPKLVNNT